MAQKRTFTDMIYLDQGSTDKLPDYVERHNLRPWKILFMRNLGENAQRNFNFQKNPLMEEYQSKKLLLIWEQTDKHAEMHKPCVTNTNPRVK